MGAWRILEAALLVATLGVSSSFLRLRLFPIPGDLLPSILLILASLILSDAAIFPQGIPEIPVPLAGLGALLAVSLLARDRWMLLGAGGGRAIDLFESCCRRRGISCVREGGRLVLVRHGTAVWQVRVAPGFHVVVFDRRRSEPEVERLLREWRIAVSRLRHRDPPIVPGDPGAGGGEVAETLR